MRTSLETVRSRTRGRTPRSYPAVVPRGRIRSRTPQSYPAVVPAVVPALTTFNKDNLSYHQLNSGS